MAVYHYRSVSISTDPQTITFSSLGASLEGRTIPTDLTVAPVVIPVSKKGGAGREVSITSTTTSQFIVDASGFGALLPITIDIQVTTFEITSTVSNAKTASVAYVRRLLSITGNDEIVTDDQISERIDDAVHVYSGDRPRNIRQEYAGNSEYEQVVPTYWLNGTSDIRRIESPGGNQARTFEDENEFEVVTVDTTERTIANASSGATSVTLSTVAQAVYFKDGEIVTVKDATNSETNWVSANGNTTTGAVALKNALANTYNSSPRIKKQNHVMLMVNSPPSSDYFIIEYTGRHVHTDSEDTVLTIDYNAVMHLAGAYTAFMIANQMGKHIAANIGADSVNHLANSEVWRTMGEEMMKVYDTHMKKGDVPSTPYGKVRELDARYSWGRAFMYHGQRER